MDAKQILLKETFEDKFDMKRFERWTIEFFNKARIIAPYKNNINYFSEFRFHIKSYSFVADFTDADRNKIAVYAVELESGRNVEKARSKQRNFISKLISGNVQYDAAIAAFYSENEPRWRLSLVRLDKEFLAGGKVKTSITPAKRFSYLVGKGEPSSTAMDQLFPIFQSENFNPTLDKIEAAFSVETVTKEFFDRYRDKYYELKDFLDKNEQFTDEAATHGFTSEQFAKKLMGQLAFLYFLQKKGWLGVKVVPHTLDEKKYKNAYYINKASREIIPKVYKQTNIDEYRIQPSVLLSKDFTDSEADVLAGCFEADSWNNGDKKFIRYIFDDCLKKEGKYFFDDYLEPFFYEALRINRGKNHYYKRFNCKIPFLNGGLFDPIENYEWDRVRFEIPNEMFSNRHIKGDRDADGILDIFERYNFTMNEDEPLEREVAVDPEMLGKIFENLLDAKDRKNKGAFYTPREIVHYMCQESLCNYLVNEVNLPYDDIKDFIMFGEIRKDEDCSKNVDLEDDVKRNLPRNIYDSLSNIDAALVNIRVADPAVGSGAFPLGMLSEIVKLRNIITEYRAHQIPAVKRLERKLEYYNRSPYRIKLETIRNCIFAVDIESSAIDIAKLRLWLSLVVDQEVNTDTGDILFTNEDKDPHQLPNLDYNIMCGNSLIDEFEGIKLIDDDLFDTDKKTNLKDNSIEKQMSLFNNQIDILTNRLFAEQEKFFAENDSARKNVIKTNINYILDAIIRAKLSSNNNEAGLARYEASLKEKTKPYFLWKLEFAKVFKEKGGFDVVIGNPPYVGESGHKEIFRPIANTEFGKKFYCGKMDFFYFFFHKAIDIGNENAEITLITTNYYTTAFGAKKLREDFYKRTKIRSLINFNELKVFASALGQHNMITSITKQKRDNIIARTCICNQVGVSSSNLINKILYSQDKQSNYIYLKQEQIFEGNEFYIRLEGINIGNENSIGNILDKMASMPLALGNIADVNQGVVSGCDYISSRNIDAINDTGDIMQKDGIFVFDLLNKRDKMIYDSLNNNEKTYFKAFFKNSEIEKYYCNTNNTKTLLYLGKGINSLDGMPNIKRHLDRFINILKARREVQTGAINYFQLQWSRKEDIFYKPKIVVPYRSKINSFAYNDVEWFCRSDVYIITLKNNDYKLKYLLGLLNSKLYFAWLYHRGKRKGAVLELFQVPLCEIPIIEADKTAQEKYEKIVNQILAAKQTDPTTDTSVLEAEIDKMVYELYGLTDEEKKIVEGV